MNLTVLHAFFKTAMHALLLFGKDATKREQVKRAWGMQILKTFGIQMRVEGVSPLPGAQILVGNHVSYLDIPVILACFPRAVFVAKEDLLQWPIIGKAANAAGTIFVSREKGRDRSNAREQIIQALQEKNSAVVVFPSGTTSLDESIFWKKGIFEIAESLDLPVQLFKLDYSPLRACAYIDEDQLLAQMKSLTQVQEKTVTLRWLERIEKISNPSMIAESMRKQVARV